MTMNSGSTARCKNCGATSLDGILTHTPECRNGGLPMMAAAPPTPEQDDEQAREMVNAIFWHGFNQKAAPGSTQPFDPDAYVKELLSWRNAYAERKVVEAREQEHDWLFDKFGDTDCSGRDFDLIRNEAESRLNTLPPKPEEEV